eukprot:scaffold28078_cov57-Phaeocystis_antarctica.AAC.5
MQAGGGALRHCQDGAMAMRVRRGELLPVATIRHHLTAQAEGLGKACGETRECSKIRRCSWVRRRLAAREPRRGAVRLQPDVYGYSLHMVAVWFKRGYRLEYMGLQPWVHMVTASRNAPSARATAPRLLSPLRLSASAA